MSHPTPVQLPSAENTRQAANSPHSKDSQRPSAKNNPRRRRTTDGRPLPFRVVVETIPSTPSHITLAIFNHLPKHPLTDDFTHPTAPFRTQPSHRPAPSTILYKITPPTVALPNDALCFRGECPAPHCKLVRRRRRIRRSSRCKKKK